MICPSDRGRQDLAARAELTQRVIEEIDRPFSWKTRGNCIHLFRAQLTAFGYAVPPVPGFSSVIGAKRAMTKRGFVRLEDLVTHYLARIPTSRLLVGDIVMMPGHDARLNALGVFVGQRRIRAWHGKDLSRLLAFDVTAGELLGAWAVDIQR